MEQLQEAVQCQVDAAVKNVFINPSLQAVIILTIIHIIKIISPLHTSTPTTPTPV